MTRSISAASLAKLATKKGTEPVCLVEVEWVPGQPTIIYGDRAYVDHPEIDGRIQSITNITDILNFSKNGSAQSVTVVFLDTDAKIKTIYNNVDIHRKKVWIWQWFHGIPLSDKFLIFQGVIATPITWKESERTFLFDVISKLDDFQVGFSAEEGNFANLPDSLIGKAWPLVFGTVSKVQALLLDDIPHGGGGRRRGGGADSVTKEPVGIRDPSLAAFITDTNNSVGFQLQLALAYFIAALEADYTAKNHGEIGDLDPLGSGTGTFTSLAKQYLAAGNKALQTAHQAQLKVNNLKSIHDKQKAFEKPMIGVTNGSSFPQNQIVAINIGGAIHTGYFQGDSFFIVDAQHPAAERYQINFEDPSTRVGEPVITRDNFFFADAGTPIRIGVDPITGQVEPVYGQIRYIVSCGPTTTVLAVYAWQTDQNGLRFLNPVPPSYYQVLNLMYGSLPVTALLLPTPLSTLVDTNVADQPSTTINSSSTLTYGDSLGWEDELFVTVQSAIGPNTVDIMIWLIENYTDYSYDPVSFAAVRTQVDPFGMNFAITDRPMAIKLLQDLAYQARCYIFAKNEVFFLKYLSVADPSTATITEADIIHQSLEIQTTQTEDLVTKYVAEWQPDYLYDQAGDLTVGNVKFKVILEYNTHPYGIHEQTYNYFAFNQQLLVEKSATFWIIRDSNMFKRVICKVPIKFLNIEVMDTITLNFSHPYVANGSVIGVVEEATFNADDYTISLNVWVPVRLGEMTLYNFAYPANLTEIDFWPTIKDINEGRTLTNGTINSNVTQPPGEKPFTGDPGNGGSITYAQRQKMFGDPIPSDSNPNTSNVPISTNIASLGLQPGIGGKPPGTTKYQYDKLKPEPAVIIPPVNGTYPGKVEEAIDSKTYTVRVYLQGMDGPATLIPAVRQIDLDNDSTLETDTAVMVTQTVWANAKGELQTEWVMQVPVWQ
jgi:hypothetical protein